MPSPDAPAVPRAAAVWWLLLRKELRELAASRSYWLLLLVVGALVGHAFLTAAATYAEASGGGGGPGALAQGLNPLSGIVVPTLGAYDLAATLLLPFVVIRLVASEKETGALALMLQAPVRFGAVIAAKGVALLVGWLVAGIPGLVALATWRAIGGHLYAPEVLVVALGHLLRGVLTIGIGAAAAALAASAASAAIVALTVTLGGWALDYVGAARGGVLEALAAYTPTATLRVFEQGEVRAGAVLVPLLLGGAGLAVAAAWLRTGRRTARRLAGVAAAVVVAAVTAAGATRVRASWDASEDRRNSFSAADEIALRRIDAPLRVTAYLAAEDPRLVDLERGVLAKLRRTLPSVDVRYVARGRSGLFERAEGHYGEVWYEIGGRRAMERSATEEIVLETIYRLAGVPDPQRRDEPAYPGYPFAGRPRWAPVLFFVLWPLVVAAAWWRSRRLSPRPRGVTASPAAALS
ncbi:MAG TPA: ABC transporter permease subunit [Gemmatimonadaceae bacterium]|nr:ABC transporter permease subunit [Gemmatimonadaceae bacterium]